MPAFYRIVRSDPPTEADFLSYRELGLPLTRDTPELRRSWEGVSVYDAEDAARVMATRFPRIGSFIAELDIPEGGAVRYDKTGRDPSHYDLWGEAAAMLSAVRRVVAV